MQAIIDEKNRIVRERQLHQKKQDPPNNEVPGSSPTMDPREKAKEKKQKAKNGGKSKTK